jgi:hypothetical protein
MSGEVGQAGVRADVANAGIPDAFTAQKSTPKSAPTPGRPELHGPQAEMAATQRAIRAANARQD